jgi:alanyl-tRNA synthetase
MEKTIRLFDRDPYMMTFQANVLEQMKKNDNWLVVLDQTAFYPESGGQPYDLGTIDQQQVHAVHEDRSIIYHYMKQPVNSERVLGQVRFDRRLDHMQQHCGQHLLSAALQRLMQVETLAFHLGRQQCTIDVKAEQLTLDDLQSVEDLVNGIIQENRHIDTRFFSREEVERKYIVKVPQDEELIRMVHITDFDLSACCGTHPRFTGEVGLLKILGVEKHRGGSRISFVCGKRAMHTFQQYHIYVQELMKKFKTNENQLVAKVERHLAEYEQLKRWGRNQYQDKLRYEAHQLEKDSSDCSHQIPYDVYFLRTEDRSVQELKDLAKTVIELKPGLVLFVRKEEHDQVQWVLASSSSLTPSVTEIIDTLKLQYGGKGGGSAVFGQWSGAWPKHHPVNGELTWLQTTFFNS